MIDLLVRYRLVSWGERDRKVLTETVRPDFPVFGAAEPTLDGEFLEIGIAAVLIDACTDELTFLERDKGDEGFEVFVVWEVDQEDESEEGDYTVETGDAQRTYAALDDEDPPPSTVSGDTLHLDQAESQDATESRSQRADEIENRVSLPHLVLRQISSVG
ncbi:MAG: hypothetical protein Q9168_003872 [Polycauliona sp. 1 TL-2023]